MFARSVPFTTAHIGSDVVTGMNRDGALQGLKQSVDRGSRTVRPPTLDRHDVSAGRSVANGERRYSTAERQERVERVDGVGGVGWGRWRHRATRHSGWSVWAGAPRCREPTGNCRTTTRRGRRLSVSVEGACRQGGCRHSIRRVASEKRCR